MDRHSVHTTVDLMDQLPPTSETRVGSRVVFLIDESEPLRECIAGGTKSKAESIATALNSLLNQLVAVADLEVAVAGYRGDPTAGPTSVAAGAGRWPDAASFPPRPWPTPRWSWKTASAAWPCRWPASRKRPCGSPSGTCRSSAAASFPCWAMPIAGTWSSRERRRRRSGANRPWSSVSWATWCRSRWRWPWNGSWGFRRRADRRWSSTCTWAAPRPDARALSVQRHPSPAGPAARLVPLVERAAGLYDRRPPRRPGAGEHRGPAA